MSRGGGGGPIYRDGKTILFWLVVLAFLMGLQTALGIVKFFIVTGVAVLATVVGLLPGAAGDFGTYRSSAQSDHPAATAPQAPAKPDTGVPAVAGR